MEVATRSLAELESVIERGLTTFVDVGTALMEIRDGLLYRQTHTEFDDYCRERWGMSRFYAHRLIVASEVVQALPMGNTPVPKTERVARELARVEPEHRAETWQTVVEEHGPEATAKEVKEVVREQSFKRQFRPDSKPSNVTAMPSLVERLPETTVNKLADMFYEAQLPAMVDQVVSLAAQHMRRAAVAAQKELARINWDHVTDEMRQSKSVFDSIFYMDEEIARFTTAMALVRQEPKSLRRIR